MAHGKGMWFQQDGARCPVAAVRQWLGKFDGRVISHLTEWSWPSRNPDLPPGLLVLSIRLSRTETGPSCNPTGAAIQSGEV